MKGGISGNIPKMTESFMTQADAFGHDPQIRYMRRVFSAIETAQKDFLTTIHVQSIDPRLRPVRETALKHFERSWMSVAAKVNGSDIEAAVTIYLICLAKALSAVGIPLPETPVSRNWDPALAKMIDEVLK